MSMAYFGGRVENRGLYSLLSGYVPLQPFKGLVVFVFQSKIRLPVRHHTLAFSLLTSACYGETYRLVKPAFFNGLSLSVKPFFSV